MLNEFKLFLQNVIVPTYLPTYPTLPYLPTYLPTYLLTYQLLQLEWS